MKILIYKESKSSLSDHYQLEIEEWLQQHEVQTYTSIPDLIIGLNRLENKSGILVLFAESQETLIALLAIKDMLLKHRCILILPDRENKTISQGHQLHPRFLTYSDGNLKEICQVLNKMINHTKRTSYITTLA